MQFQIEWSAVVGRYRLEVKGVEVVPAQNPSLALNLIRTSILTKLSSLNSPFELVKYDFVKIPDGTEFSVAALANFLRSINDEGGMQTRESTGSVAIRTKNLVKGTVRVSKHFPF